MKKLFWFSAGVIAGFVAAHQLSRTEKGQDFLSQVDLKTKQVSNSLVEGFREREAQLREALDEAKTKLDEIAND